MRIVARRANRSKPADTDSLDGQILSPTGREQGLKATPWLLRKKVLGLILAGAFIQIFLSVYYLAMGHAPAPHHLPVGYISASGTEVSVEGAVNGDSFVAQRYDDAAALVSAIKAKEVFGGVDLSGAEPQIYVASAAGRAADSAVRTTFTDLIKNRTAGELAALSADGRPVAAEDVQRLTAPVAVVDVVPLTNNDRGGTSLGFLVQALLIGGTVASTGLGGIGPLTTRSWKRGVGHVAVLVSYAAVSAGVVLIAAGVFGVIPAGSELNTYAMFLLLSLAITGSVAGLVTLIGPAGLALGTAYFLFGLAVSGATILPEFLPTVGRIVGQALPTGAGATAIRDSLYFPEASVAGPVLVMSLYAGAGIMAVLVTNALPNRSTGAFLVPAHSKPAATGRALHAQQTRETSLPRKDTPHGIRHSSN